MRHALLAVLGAALLLLTAAACGTEKQAAPKGNPVAGGKIFQEQCASVTVIREMKRVSGRA
jgi:mono/diheme cytochrome c family protein